MDLPFHIRLAYNRVHRRRAAGPLRALTARSAGIMHSGQPFVSLGHPWYLPVECAGSLMSPPCQFPLPSPPTHPPRFLCVSKRSIVLRNLIDKSRMVMILQGRSRHPGCSDWGLRVGWRHDHVPATVRIELLQPGAHVRLFSLWRTLSVRILTDVNVGSDLRILLRRH